MAASCSDDETASGPAASASSAGGGATTSTTQAGGGNAGGATGSTGGSGGSVACTDATDCGTATECGTPMCVGNVCSWDYEAVGTVCGMAPGVGGGGGNGGSGGSGGNGGNGGSGGAGGGNGGAPPMLTGFECNGAGQCMKSLGTDCGAASECVSDFCADGVCCDAVCDGDCDACSAAGACNPLSSGLAGDCSGTVCDGAGYCVVSDEDWSEKWGDTAAQSAADVAVDSAGNILLVGSNAGTIDFNGTALATSGGVDGYVVKLSADGTTTAWGESLGLAGDQRATHVAVDGNDYVYVAGEAEGNINDCAGSPLTVTGQDIFVASFDDTGTCRYVVVFDGSATPQLTGFDVDDAGNAYLAGYFNGNLTFGNQLTATSNDVFTAKLNDSGTPVWEFSYGDGASDIANDLVVDSNGNVIVTGYFFGGMNFGDGALPNATDANVYVVRFDNDGLNATTVSFLGSDHDAGFSIDVDSANNILLGGWHRGSLTLGGTTLNAGTDADVYVAKLNQSDLSVAWAYGFGEDTPEGNARIAVAADGGDNLVVVGDYHSAAFKFESAGASLADPSGTINAFFGKYTPDGTLLHGVGVGDTSTDQRAAGVVSDPSTGDTLIVGEFAGDIDFGGGAISSAGAEDAYVARMNP